MKKYSSSIIMFINIIISYFLIKLNSFLIFLHIIIFYSYRYWGLIKNFEKIFKFYNNVYQYNNILFFNKVK